MEPDRVSEGLDTLLTSGELKLQEFEGTSYIYLPDLLLAEQDIAIHLRTLASYPTEPPKRLGKQHPGAGNGGRGVVYAPLQKQAIQMALSSRVMVLTGGPGTGKTTTVNAILSLYESGGDQVALCAPTGPGGQAPQRADRTQGIHHPPAAGGGLFQRFAALYPQRQKSAEI